MPLVNPLKRARLAATALIMAALAGGTAASAQVILKALAPSAKQILPETIQALEQQVTMPVRAGLLTSYDRYYAPGTLETRDVIVGVFLKRPVRLQDGAQPVPGFLSAYMTTVEKLPRIPGGSCNVVTIYFDLTDGRFIKLPAGGKESPYAVCNRPS